MTIFRYNFISLLKNNITNKVFQSVISWKKPVHFSIFLNNICINKRYQIWFYEVSCPFVYNIIIFSIFVSDNDISEVGGLEFKRLTRLTSLEIRANKLTSTKGLYLPNVKKLYLADNNISVIEDLSILEHLTTLYLGGNNISKLDGFTESLKNLQYLNLRLVSILICW